MTDDFTNHPKSLTEIKADRTDSACDNTPRDVLIAMLRSIDNGEIKPTALVVAYIEPDAEGDFIFKSMQASPNSVISAGMAAMLQDGCAVD